MHPPLGLICLHGHRIPLSPEEPGGSPHACVQPLGVGLTRPARAPPQKEVYVGGPLLYMCRWVDLMHVFMFSFVLVRSMALLVIAVAQWFAVALQLAQWLGVVRRGFEWFMALKPSRIIV